MSDMPNRNQSRVSDTWRFWITVVILPIVGWIFGFGIAKGSLDEKLAGMDKRLVVIETYKERHDKEAMNRGEAVAKQTAILEQMNARLARIEVVLDKRKW